MGDGRLVVRGGVGGLRVATGELAAAAAVLTRMADLLEEPPPALPWDAEVSTGALAVRGVRLARAEQLRALGLRARLTADAYAAAEAEARRLGEAARAPVAGATRLLSGQAGRVGLLVDGSLGAVRAVPTNGRASVPTTLVGLLGVEAELAEAGGGRIRVVEVPQPGGGRAWVVSLPGTQVWNPAAGSNPWDLTTDVHVAAGETSAVAVEGVLEALAAAMTGAGRAGGVGAHDLVLLAGHSEGGLVALAVAGHPALAGRPVAVLTAGSPTGGLRGPPSTPVLALEHVDDVVPRLDGIREPDLPERTVVRRDLGLAGSPRERLARAHASETYAETARLVDAFSFGAHPSVDHWRSVAAPALAGSTFGPAVVREYVLERR